MSSWWVNTTLESSLLICVVLLVRPLIRRFFGASVTCALWLIPAIGVLLPQRPVRPELPLTTLRLPGEQISQSFFSAAESWLAPGVPRWEWLWIAGAALLLALQVARAARFHRRLRSTSEPLITSSPHIHRLLCRFGANPARLFTTTLDGAPFVMGVFRPRVFLPRDFQDRFSAQEQRWILIHELTHIRRGDLWLRLVAEAFRALFWFNPLVHVAIHLLRQDQEYACDQAVVSGCTGHERSEYGKALLRSMCRRNLSAMPAFFGNGRDRFIMLGKHRSSIARTTIGLAVCASIGAFALTSAPDSIAQPVSAPGDILSEETEPAGRTEEGITLPHDGEAGSLPERRLLLIRDGEVRSLPQGVVVVLQDGVVRTLPEGGNLVRSGAAEPAQSGSTQFIRWGTGSRTVDRGSAYELRLP